MNLTIDQRLSARTAVMEGLSRLRSLFPLEARLATASTAAREHYAQLLSCWLSGKVPYCPEVDSAAHDTLRELDAIVITPEGIGCYPFSARATGISVSLLGGTVSAMCAVDALAMARLAEQRVTIGANCVACNASLSIEVENDGSLDHDQSDRAHVIWRTAMHAQGTCSESLCRDLLFICPGCATPADSTRFTLPQAAAIGNAFFAFQRKLLTDIHA